MTHKLLAGVFSFGILGALAGDSLGGLPPRARYDGHKVVRVLIETATDRAVMETISDDPWSHQLGPGAVDYRVTPDRMAALDASGLQYEVMIDDVQRRIDDERAALGVRGAGFFDNYHTYDEISAFVDGLVTLHPDMATRVTAGLSLQGRSIFGVRLRAPGAPNDPNRAAVLFNGGQHAREWISPATVCYVADRLASGYGVDPRITAILDEVDIFLLPVINPDGYVHTWNGERLWRKNRRVNGDGSIGVDLNRNWDFAWGGTGSSGVPSNDLYRGPAPFSEPESLALAGFIQAIPGLRAHIDFHSYSQLVLGPWGWTEAAAPDGPELNALGAAMADAIYHVHGETYVAGPISTTLYLADGSVVDWVYGDQGVFSWTIELRDEGQFGFVLPPEQIIPTGEENFEAVLTLAEWATEEIEIRLAGAFPTIVQPGESAELAVQIVTRFGETLDPTSPVMRWRLEGASAWQTVGMSGAGESWTGALPALPCGRRVEVQFAAATTSGDASTLPNGTDAIVLDVLATTTAFDDTAETSTGWTVGAPGDNATTGVWLRADPVGTAAQPEDDHTPAPGTMCFVTGNAAPGASVGTNDVDGGTTTLISPILDASTPGEAFIVYHRWYSNDQGSGPNADSMPVSISNDGGATWTLLEDVSENANAWVRVEHRIADFVAPTSQVRLRFQARDLGTGSIVEAGVDDVRVFVIEPCVAILGDVDGDGTVGFADLNLLLGSYGQAGAPGELPGDVDVDGDVDFADLNLLLNNYGL